MIKRTTKELCAVCKGSRRLCGASICPILVKKSMQYISARISKTELNGYSEWLLVGEYGYPKLRYGPISAITTVPWRPEEWARDGLDFSEILRLRIQTMYPFQRRNVDRPPDIYEPLGESIVSVEPVGIELFLKKPPRMRMRFDADIPPVGGSAPLSRVELEDNPKVPRRIESIIMDRLKAYEAVRALYDVGASIYYIQKIFSAGFLGISGRKRIVPTRWGITAVDSILGNSFLREIRGAPSISGSELYFWEYLGNRYYLVLIPSDFWAMEMFEVWLPNSVWVSGIGRPIVIQNHEDYDGKPIRMDGGYYAIRMGALEWLRKQNRISMVLAVRIITPRYIAPVGNWQIRESIRLALERGPIARGEVHELISMMREMEPSLRFIDFNTRSWLLRRMRIPKLDEFLRRA